MSFDTGYLLGLIIVIYFIPSLVAHGRVNFRAIFILNLFLGWSLIGWVIALVWALTKESNNSNTNQIISETKVCPFCAEEIKIEAILCRFCGKSLDNQNS